jgi:hypothetical protein
MKALSIDAQTLQVSELDIQMQANTTYTFFGSILIDELQTLNKHVIYTDANALSQSKPAYFIGEQLIVGDALIVGKEAFTDLDVSIMQEELSALLREECNEFYAQALSLLSQTDLNLYRTFLVNKDDETIALNAEWVLYTFNIADERTQDYFLDELEKALDNKQAPEIYMQKMAGLALKAGA